MNTVLYFSPSGTIYETQAYTKADIDQLILDKGLECLTSADRQFDFWFSPAARRCQRRVNQAATELLLATTPFTAKTVPLLQGGVVIASHDSDGDLDGLSWQQQDILVEKIRTLSKRDEQTLTRRANRLARRLRRKTSAVPVAPVVQAHSPVPAGIPA
jgi:hypothetical protein